ncbi:hypothetical protein ABPG75_009998 [Micractinium tetrahymenae]
MRSPAEAGPGVPLACKRWQHAFFSTPAAQLWCTVEVCEPPGFEEWSMHEQEAWLAGRLRALRNVGPLVRELTVTFDEELLSECLQALGPGPGALESLCMSCKSVPTTAANMRALLPFSRLQALEFGLLSQPLPRNAGWVLRQLPALRSLDIGAVQFPPGFLADAAHLSQLTDLCLSSQLPLPDVQPLSALSRLNRLHLSERQGSDDGLSVLPGSCFPHRTYARFASPVGLQGDLQCPILCDCQLSVLPRLQCITGLRSLVLDGNKLTKLPDLGPSTSLTSLSLRRNTGLVLSLGNSKTLDALPAQLRNLRLLVLGSFACGSAAPLVRLARAMPDLRIQ